MNSPIEPSQQPTAEADNILSSQDQARVDRYLSTGFNRVPRKTFKPLLLLFLLALVVLAIGKGAAMITRIAGISA